MLEGTGATGRDEANYAECPASAHTSKPIPARWNVGHGCDAKSSSKESLIFWLRLRGLCPEAQAHGRVRSCAHITERQ